jgi:hypothetical protein
LTADAHAFRSSVADHGKRLSGEVGAKHVTAAPSPDEDEEDRLQLRLQADAEKNEPQ